MINSSSLHHWQLAAAVVESSNDAIICTDLRGTITSWNKAATTIFGYRPEEVIGQPIFLLAAPGREDEMPIILDQVTRGERIQHYETVRRHKEGRQVAISLSVSPIRSDSGRIVGVSKIARNVTQRNEAEAELRRLTETLEPQVVDRNGPEGNGRGGSGNPARRTYYEFLDTMPRIPAGWILLDLKMPEIEGLALQGELAELGLKMPVIVISGDGNISTAVAAVSRGAIDFIETPFDELLIASIEAALANTGRGLANQEGAKAVERIATLSPRERQVLRALTAGRQNKMIAHDLGISIRTVEVHRARMLKRLGTRRLAEAIRLAVLADLAPPTWREPALRLAATRTRS